MTTCSFCLTNKNDFISTNCCHSSSEFISIFKNLHTNFPKTLDDFLFSQPPSLVIHTINHLANDKTHNINDIKTIKDPILYYKNMLISYLFTSES